MEGDSIVSHESHCVILTLVDRKSKFLIAKKVGKKTKENMTAAILKSLKNQTVHTIAFDNGSEFAGHKKIAQKLKAAIFFAKPYRSYERGLNEHTNGLIRQFLSKKFDFVNITDNELKIITDFINNRPKVLGYKTPFEVFALSS